MEDPSKHAGPHDNAGGTPQADRLAGAAADGADQPVRCVLLTDSASGPAPPALLEALRRRRLDVTLCRSTFEALAHIVGAPDGSHSGAPASALVIIEPMLTDSRRLAELLEALDIFAPRTVRWEFDANAPVKLHALRAPAPTPAQVHVRQGVGDAVARSQAAARLSQQPDLRLAGVDPSFPIATTDEDDEDATSVSLLSEDEINMLLGDDDVEQAP